MKVWINVLPSIAHSFCWYADKMQDKGFQPACLFQWLDLLADMTDEIEIEFFQHGGNHHENHVLSDKGKGQMRPSDHSKSLFCMSIWGDANCHLRRGTYSTTDDDQWLLKVGASWRFLRKKQATLSFKWNDILNRRRDLNRSVSGYGYHESFRPQIHSYALVSLRYRFSLTKSKTDKNSHKQQNPNK